MWESIEARISSNWINVLNFVIFDVVLISLLYYLSADIMGRLNDSTLRDGEPRKIFISCPPVLGGGLCTTHRWRALLLLFARFLGLGLILVTNMTIRGEARIEVFRANETVLTVGSIANFTKADFELASVGRSGCQGHRPPSANGIEGNSTVVYYGELRGRNFSECVTNRSLLTGTVVEFGSEILLRNMSTGSPCKEKRRERASTTVAEYFCPKATLSCVTIGQQVILISCRGLLEHEGETYITEEGAARPNMTLEPTHGRWISGVRFNSTEWLDGFLISFALLKDAIDATYAAGRERREIKKLREVQWTLVSPFWLVALAFKVLLVGSLALGSIMLKRAGFRTVAHDEQRLAEILNTGLQETAGPGRRRTGEETEGQIFLRADENAGGLLVYADSYPRRTGLSTAVEDGESSLRRRNVDLHLAEEKYY